MNPSVPIAGSVLIDELMPATVPAASRAVAYANVPFDEGRWVAWVTKGRVADAAFAEKVRASITVGIALAVGVAGLWVILG